MAHPKPHQGLLNLSLSYGIKWQLYIFCYLHVTKVNLVTQMLLQHFENFGVTILTLRPCLCCCLLFLLERPRSTVVKTTVLRTQLMLTVLLLTDIAPARRAFLRNIVFTCQSPHIKLPGSWECLLCLYPHA